MNPSKNKKETRSVMPKRTTEKLLGKKQAEESSVEEQTLLHTLMNNLLDSIYFKDVESRFIQINQIQARRFGLKDPAEAIGKTDFDFFSEEHSRPAYEDEQAIIRSGQPLVGKEEKETWPDGRVGWVSTTKMPLRDQEGKIIGTFGISRDITDRKQLDEELKLSEEKFSKAFYASPNLMAITRPENGLIIEINDSFCHFLGYQPEECIGHTTAELQMWADPEQRTSVLRKLGESGAALGVVIDLQTKSGEILTVIDSFTFLAIRNQQYLLSVATDITERKHAENALRESEQRFRTFIEQSADGAVLVNEQGKIIEWNLAQEKITGISKNQAIGSSLAEIQYKLLTPARRARTDIKYYKDALSSAFQSGESTQFRKPVEVEIQTLSGERKFIRQNAFPIKTEHGFRVGSIIHDVTASMEAEATIRQRLTELEFLYQSGLGLGQILEPEEVAKKIIEQMEKQMNWHHCAIRLYDAEAQILKVIGINAPGLENEIDRQGLEEHFDNMVQKVGDGLTGQAVELGQTLRVGDLKHDPRYKETFTGLNSGLYVPIQINSRVIGIISVENELPNAFSESDERLVNILANQVAIALENGRLHKETLQQLKQLRSLRSIDLAITSSLDLNVTLDILIHQAMQQLIVDGIAVFLLQPDINSLRHASSQGFKTNMLEDLKWISLADDSLLGLAVMERHILDSQCTLEPHVRLKNIWKEEMFHSMISLPLLSKGELKGVIGIFFRSEESRPTKPQMDFLETLAGQAAIAIENVQLFDGLHKTNMELAIAYDATIEGWSRAMDLRDKETEGHTRRVVDMTMKLASYFGFAGEALMQIRRGALLHDIGKLGVPDNILLKPDKLTEEEWVIMKKHPAFAFEMLAPIHYLNQAINIPYCHHEKWDGTGYPRGLSGERIPLEARIFAVVDVWDALTSDRPYRKAWTKEKALEYIGSQSGTHFDPAVVERFLDLKKKENQE